MNKKAMCMVLVSVLITGLAAVPSRAADPAKEDGRPTLAGSPLGKLIMGHIGRLLVLKSELNVTDDQRKRIAAEIKNHKDEIRPIAKLIFEKRQAVRDSVINNLGDEKTILQASEDLGKAIGKAALLASKVVAKVQPIFTPEQQERIKNFRMGMDKATSEWINQIGQQP
ncbi:MAG: Spy/CpxP family protein refolding chaperone [Desulfomonilaceae bacterium]